MGRFSRERLQKRKKQCDGGGGGVFFNRVFDGMSKVFVGD